MDSLCIKAGKGIYGMIQDGGFDWSRVKAYFAPAAGPRWLIAGGFDMALLTSGLLGQGERTLLVGASAGAWRFAAWIQPEPEKSYRALREAYIAQSYTRSDTPQTVLQSLIRIVNAAIEDDAVSFALDNKRYRLAVITARAKHLAGSESWLLQRIGLGGSFLLNALSRSTLTGFFERVVFFTGKLPPSFCLQSGFRGSYAPLNEINFKAAVLASGAIPLVVAGVRDIYGATTGIYRDGGIMDYHLTMPYTPKEGEITLFFHHQERIIPGWMDKGLKRRKPPEEALHNVLMVHPSEAFIEGLPGSRVPDRTDFMTFMDQPQTRIDQWRQAVSQAEPLGEAFLELVESGKIRRVVTPL